MRILRLLPLTFVVACGVFTGPGASGWHIPQGQRINAPPSFVTAAVMWSEMEQCSLKDANLSRIQWYRALEPMLDPNGNELNGMWVPPHSIYLDPRVVDGASPYAGWYKTRIIEHEMLHDLLQTDSHPPVFTTCGVR